MFYRTLKWLPAQVLGIALLLAAMAFGNICPEAGKCGYYSIYTSPIAYLWTVPEAENISDTSKAIRSADFLVYAANDSLTLNPCEKDYASGKTTCSSTELSHPTAKVTSDSVRGFFYVKVSSRFPAKNLPLGMQVNENAKPVVFRYYTFYVPRLEYSYVNAQGDTVVIDSTTSISLPVDSSMTVTVRAVIPVGPSAGKTDSTINKRAFYLEPIRGAENLKFTTLAGDSTDRVILEKGVGHFSVRSAGAVSGASFVSKGLVNPSDSTFFVEELFPGKFAFENPHLPNLDSAFIYDADGDGKGDSVIAYFSGKTDSVSWDSIFYIFPNGASRKEFSGEYRRSLNGGVMELLDVKTSLSETLGNGELEVFVKSKLSGTSAGLSTVLEDRIGPVILKATLIEGVSGARDTLVLDFNKNLDTAFSAGSVLRLSNGDKVRIEAVSKNGKRWTVTTVPGTVKVGDSLSVVSGLGDLGLVTADGNFATFNLPAKVTNAGRVYLSNENNGFFDSDADGRMDSVTVEFENPITEEDLENMRLQFFWKDSAGNELIISPASRELVISKDGKLVSYKLSESEQDKVQKGLTSIDESRTYGYAALENVSVVNGDTVSTFQYLDMNDRIPPVIRSTFLSPESRSSRKADRLTVKFSEPIDVSEISNANFLGFVVAGDTVFFDFSHADWNEDRTEVRLSVASGEKLLSRANPNDSLFTVPSAVSDIRGNSVQKNSRLVGLEGDPRVVMETASIAAVDRAGLDVGGPAFTERLLPKGTPTGAEMEGSLGVMLDVAFATIFDDSTGESLDFEKVGLKWSMEVYTNLGSFVAAGHGKIRCDDPDFAGNCFENAKRLYLRWNMRSASGRKVGVGAYLVQFHLKVYGQKHSYTYDKIFKWGVHCGKASLALDD